MSVSGAMEKPQRRRSVTSCIPCYQRKQKCNRQYPCNHCTRRRRPEECNYDSANNNTSASHGFAATSRTDIVVKATSDEITCAYNWEQQGRATQPSQDPTGPGPTTTAFEVAQKETRTLVKTLGYAEESDTNILALIRNFYQPDHVPSSINFSERLSEDCVVEVQDALKRMPPRAVIDFLVQYYIAEIDWFYNIIHPPWFLARYQRWWALEDPQSIEDVEFATLVLRICSYTTQYLPSPKYVADKVKGMLLSEIGSICDSVSEDIAAICARVNPRGSLVRVIHQLHSALTCVPKGKIAVFGCLIYEAIRSAQAIGLDKPCEKSTMQLDEMEKEMRRRTFCNLYILDSLHSCRTDTYPLFPDQLHDDLLPRLQLPVDSKVDSSPNVFLHRTLTARLWRFWRSMDVEKDCEYDLLHAQERYERICKQFLPTIPAVFALQPNQDFDEQISSIPLQRQRFHINLYHVICHNFGGVLLLSRGHVSSMPGWKQVLVRSHQKVVAAAALQTLQSVFDMHSLLGGTQVRFPALIIHSFEAGVRLACLCITPGFPTEWDHESAGNRLDDPLGPLTATITRDKCMQASRKALNLLEMLADVSASAEAGARALSRLIDKATNQGEMAVEKESVMGTDVLDEWTQTQLMEIGEIDFGQPWAQVPDIHVAALETNE